LQLQKEGEEGGEEAGEVPGMEAGEEHGEKPLEDPKDLKEEAESIGSQLSMSMRVVSELSASCRRISARVLDYASFQNREFQTNPKSIEKLEALLDEQSLFVKRMGEMEYLDMQFSETEGRNGTGTGTVSTKGGRTFLFQDDTTGSIFSGSKSTSGDEEEGEEDVDEKGFQ
jgi:predicted RNase H-like nuclease (RuvC/YqgF family)